MTNLSTLNGFGTLVKNSLDCICEGLFLVSLFSSIGLYVYLSLCQYHTVLLLLLFFGRTVWGNLSSPNQELNPCPLQWKLRVLTTGPPANSQYHTISTTIAL